MSRAVVTLQQISQEGHTVQTPIPEHASLREKVIATLRNIYDPEIPVNLYDLGLIYDISIDGRGHRGVQDDLRTHRRQGP